MSDNPNQNVMSVSQDKKRRSAKWLRLLLGGVLLIFLVSYLSRKGEILSRLTDIGWLDLVILLSLTVVLMFTLAAQFRIVIVMFGLRLPIREWIGLTFVNTMFNFFLPAKAGVLVRGVYLKSKYGFPLSKYSSLAITSQLIMLSLVSLIGLILLVLLESPGKPYYSLLIIIFLLAFVFPPLLMVFLIKTRFSEKKHGRFWMFSQGFQSGITLWATERVASFRYLLFGLLTIIFQVLRLTFCFHTLGYSVNFFEVMMVQAILSISFVLSVTPGNLGIRELLIVASSGLLGVASDVSLSAALLDRAASILVTFTVGGVYSKILITK